MGEEAKYLIRKGGAYYRPNCRGYTTSAILAGRYTFSKAQKESHPNGPDGPRDGMSIVHEDEVTDEEWLVHRDRIDALKAEVARLKVELDDSGRRVLNAAATMLHPALGKSATHFATTHEWRGYKQGVTDAANLLRSCPAPSEVVEARARAAFADYFRRNYPGPNTVIYDPDWHAPKLFRAALHAMEQAERALASEGERANA